MPLLRNRIKILLDFTPLFILVFYAITLIWTVTTTNIIFSNEHYIGLTLLVITVGSFIKRHKFGVIVLGSTLFMGLFNVLSFSAVITIHSFGGSINGHSSPEIKIQGIFILWLLIHFIVSGRHYVGITTKIFWQTLFNR